MKLNLSALIKRARTASENGTVIDHGLVTEHDPEEIRLLDELDKCEARSAAIRRRLREINEREDAEHLARLRLSRATNGVHADMAQVMATDVAAA